MQLLKKSKAFNTALEEFVRKGDPEKLKLINKKNHHHHLTTVITGQPKEDDEAPYLNQKANASKMYAPSATTAFLAHQKGRNSGKVADLRKEFDSMRKAVGPAKGGGQSELREAHPLQAKFDNAKLTQSAMESETPNPISRKMRDSPAAPATHANSQRSHRKSSSEIDPTLKLPEIKKVLAYQETGGARGSVGAMGQTGTFG